MKNRIKQVRIDAGLTQEKFAETLGLKRNSVANYEIGRNIPLDAILHSICKEFHVNEAWLRTGEGEPYCNIDGEEDFSKAMEEIGVDDPRAKQIILNYWHLSPSNKELFWHLIDNLTQK